MKSASSATLAILSSGQYVRADLYEFTLKGSGSIYRFTNADVPLTVGGNVYANNLIIGRGSISQKAGLQVGTLEIHAAPQFDDPGGGVIIGGLPFLQACAKGLFNNATVTYYKMFLQSLQDTSPGAVKWWVGTVDKATPGRQQASFTCNNVLSQLNLPMPRNVYQSSCLHTLFDSGCGLTKASFTTSGSVNGTATPTISSFNTGLTQADGYFNLGVITFTSGANSGFSRTVKQFSHSLGGVSLIYPLPSAPAVGDTFTIVPGCDKTQTTCINKFSNVIHFRGYPYIPNPETPYDGGAATMQAAPTSGSQSDGTLGSNTGGNFKGRVYVP